MTDRPEDPSEVIHRLRMVVDAATDAFVGMNSKGQITDWNKQAEAILGWPSAEVLGRILADTIIPLRYRDDHRAGLARFLATGDANILNQRIEMVALGRDGREFPIELSVGAVGVGTEAVSFHAFVHDISERRESQDALRDSEAKHHLVADQLAAAQRTAQLGSWEWDVGADRVMWSDELYRIFGVDPETFVVTYLAYLDRIHPEDRELVEAAVAGVLDACEDFAFDHRVVRTDGVVSWIHSRIHVEADVDGIPVRLSGTAANITERVVLQQELAALALVDELTGLHNRRGFVTLANHQLVVAGRNGRPVPLLFIDLNGMKSINDTFGHDQGDSALREAARFLRAAVRASDLVARIGGDEFCILLVEEGNAGSSNLERVMAMLRSGPPKGQYPLSLSVGVAWLEPESGTSVEDLMRRADRAMYNDKSAHQERARRLNAEAADERDQAGQDRDHTAHRRDRFGKERDRTAAKRDHAGDRRDDAAHKRDQIGRQRDQAAEERDDTGDQRDEAAARRDQTGRERDRAAEERDVAAEQSEASHGAGVTADSLDRSSRARSQAASDRMGASRDRSSSAGERTEAEHDRRRASVDRGAGADERIEAERDRSSASADREAGADERSEAEGDRSSASADRGAGADDRTEAEHDRQKGGRRV